MLDNAAIVWLGIAAVVVYLAGLAVAIVGLARGDTRLAILGSVIRSGVTFGFFGAGGLYLLAMPIWINSAPWWVYPLALLGLLPIATSVFLLRALVRFARRTWPRSV